MDYKKEANKNSLLGLLLMLAILIFFVSTTSIILNKGKQEEINIKLKMQREQLEEIQRQQDLIEEELNNLSEELSVKRLSTLEVVEEASSVSLDPRFEALVRATWRLETGNGTSALWTKQFNAGGIKDYYTGEYVSYTSEEEGMQALRELLLNKYVDKYDYDLKAIRSEYCYKCGNRDLKVFKEIYEEELEK